MTNSAIANAKIAEAIRSKAKTLGLDGTQVSNIDALAGCTALETLYLYGTQVSDQAIGDLKSALPNLKIYRS